MLVDLKQILAIGEERKCAIPAFNVYNLETAIGVCYAAQETGAPRSYESAQGQSRDYDISGLSLCVSLYLWGDRP